MSLDDYIAKLKISFPKAAAEIGCSRNQLWRIRRRWCRPRPELADRIIEWSAGQITLEALMTVDPDRPRQRKAA